MISTFHKHSAFALLMGVAMVCGCQNNKPDQELKISLVSDAIPFGEMKRCGWNDDDVLNLWKMKDCNSKALSIKVAGRDVTCPPSLKSKSTERTNEAMQGKWRDTLLAALADSRRVVAVWKSESPDKLSVSDILEVDEIEKLLSSIVVDETKTYHGGCRCVPDGVLIVFDSKPNTVANVLTLHHGKHINWRAGWPDDGMLTANSAETIASILDQSRCPQVVAEGP